MLILINLLNKINNKYILLILLYKNVNMIIKYTLLNLHANENLSIMNNTQTFIADLYTKQINFKSKLDESKQFSRMTIMLYYLWCVFILIYLMSNSFDQMQLSNILSVFILIIMIIYVHIKEIIINFKLSCMKNEISRLIHEYREMENIITNQVNAALGTSYSSEDVLNLLSNLIPSQEQTNEMKEFYKQGNIEMLNLEDINQNSMVICKNNLEILRKNVSLILGVAIESLKNISVPALFNIWKNWTKELDTLGGLKNVYEYCQKHKQIINQFQKVEPSIASLSEEKQILLINTLFSIYEFCNMGIFNQQLINIDLNAVDTNDIYKLASIKKFITVMKDMYLILNTNIYNDFRNRKDTIKDILYTASDIQTFIAFASNIKTIYSIATISSIPIDSIINTLSNHTSSLPTDFKLHFITKVDAAVMPSSQ